MPRLQDGVTGVVTGVATGGAGQRQRILLLPLLPPLPPPQPGLPPLTRLQKPRPPHRRPPPQPLLLLLGRLLLQRLGHLLLQRPQAAQFPAMPKPFSTSTTTTVLITLRQLWSGTTTWRASLRQSARLVSTPTTRKFIPRWYTPHLLIDNSTTGGGGYGQNIGAGASPDAVPALITNEMYNNEIGFFPLPYGQASPDMSQFENWGHFSQIVWQSTTSVGCATVDCSAGGLANTGSGVSPWFTVCNYSPPGKPNSLCWENRCIADQRD